MQLHRRALVLAFACCLFIAVPASAQVVHDTSSLATRRSAELALVVRGQSVPQASALLLSLTVPLERVVAPQVRTALKVHANIHIDTQWVRTLVTAAWVAAGIGESDAGLSSLSTRARLSAFLPEARVRVLRTDDARASYELVDDTQAPRGTQQVGYTWEGRLTWRLDRVLFAEEELGIERLRNERRESREKTRHRVLEAYFQYRRAEADLATAIEGSREALESQLKLDEAAATLDALTGGFFSAHVPAPLPVPPAVLSPSLHAKRERD